MATKLITKHRFMHRFCQARLNWIHPIPKLMSALTCAAMLGFGCQSSRQHPLQKPQGATFPLFGAVTMERIEGRSYLLSLVVKNSPSPEHFGNDKKVFVLWVQSIENGSLQSMALAGTLMHDSTAHASNIMVTTPYRRLVMTVTAEPSTNIWMPSSAVLIRQIVEAQ